MTHHDWSGLTHEFLKVNPYENLNNYVDMMQQKNDEFYKFQTKE
jgi:hypothetical protein